jgi:hypothetical protein
MTLLEKLLSSTCKKENPAFAGFSITAHRKFVLCVGGSPSRVQGACLAFEALGQFG